MKYIKKGLIVLLMLSLCLTFIPVQSSAAGSTYDATVTLKKKASKTTITVTKGSKIKISALDGSKTLSGKKLKYSSSKKSVATVSNKGIVTARKNGKAKINITTKDGKKKATLTVKVVSIVAVESISLSSTVLTLDPGTSATVTATVTPDTATNPNVTWSSSNTAVATVTDGTISAIASGEAVITATADGKSATCNVTVKGPAIIPVESIVLTPSTISDLPNTTHAIEATVRPSNATNRNITWSSSDPTVASVSSDGYVNLLKPGTATITCAAQDGSGVTANCTVEVTSIHVSGISLDQTSVELKIGNTASVSIKANVMPSDATDKSLTWKSSDEAVAKVSQTGLITATGEGLATITATANDGSAKSATCEVTVLDANTDALGKLNDKIIWKVDNDGQTLTLKGNGEMPNYNNTGMQPWNSFNSKITTVVIDSNITTIGNHNFSYMANLTTINIPENVTSIGDSALRECKKITSISIPAKTKTISTYAFSSCIGLTSLTLSEGLETIEKDAFSKTNITSVTIPATVTSLGESAFYQCENLTSITLHNSGPIGKSAFYEAGKNSGSVEAITIPKGVTIIGTAAFCNSAITGLDFEADSALTTIDINAFYACSKLKDSINIPASVKSIGNSAFSNSEITSLSFESESNLTSIGEYAFCFTKLSTVTFPESCKLTKIEKGAFDHTRLSGMIKLPDYITELGSNAFSNSGIGVFYCGPQSKLETIGSGCFNSCNDLVTVTLPKSLKVVQASAFTTLKSLTTINYRGSETEYKGIVFSNYNYEVIPSEADSTVSTLGNNKINYNYSDAS